MEKTAKEPESAASTIADATAPVKGDEKTWWENIQDLYLSFDRRTLGLTRILLGLFLIFDLFRRTSDWWKMFSNDGVLPTHYNLWRPQSSGWSILNAFADRGELWVFWAFCLVVYICVLVGFKTRVAQVLAAILVASLNGRVLLIENGGYVVHNLLLLWTAFLPLGDRFSIDALLASMKNQREKSAGDLNDRRIDTAKWRLDPHVTLVGLVLVLQIFCIYFFNIVHKKGPAWKDGTAVHYVLYVDRMANPIVGAVREHLTPGFEIFLTKFTLVLEGMVPLCMLTPIGRVWAMRIAILSINLVHIGFATTFVLGPFAWALCVFSVLLLSPEDWALVIRAMKRPHRAREVRYESGSRVAFFMCRLFKRLDRFELLSFTADETVVGLQAVAADGRSAVGMRGLSQIIAALPLGPLVAWPLRVPGVRHLGDALGRPLALAFGGEHQLANTSTEVSGRVRTDAREAFPRMDLRFIVTWFDKYLAARGSSWERFSRCLVAFLVGGFIYIYGAPMVTWTNKKLVDNEIISRTLNIKSAVVAGWSPTDFIVLLGVLVLGVSAYLLFRPIILMVLTTPATLRMKRGRFLVGARELLVFAFWMGAINQGLVELWTFKGAKLPQPTETRVFSHKLRYLQGWFMFSPNPVMDDGTLLVDAVTVDGRHVDPFSPDTFRQPMASAPHFALSEVKSYGYNQIWSDYNNRMHLSQNSSFRKPMKEYIYRLPERTGKPNDAIVKGDVYWLNDMNPRFGTTKSFDFNKKKLFSFSNPDREVQRAYREWERVHGKDDAKADEASGPIAPKKD